MPRLSVLMPVYNAEKFLSEAIESILNQSFEDFEFIIIDDCSTDSSSKIIHSYNDGRIRYFRNEQNMGITPTLNRGIKLANCELIARMDADDISHPTRFVRQLDFIDKNPDGVLYSCATNVITEDKKLIYYDNHDPRYYYYNQIFYSWIYHPTVIFRKWAVEEVGMYTTPYTEDFELFWQLTRKYKHYNQKEILLDYRVTSQSLHLVTKKDENANAFREQTLRNIRYYAGENYSILDHYLKCFQNNFEPLLQKNSITEVVKCIKEVDKLTPYILQKYRRHKMGCLFKKTKYCNLFHETFPNPQVFLPFTPYRIL